MKTMLKKIKLASTFLATSNAKERNLILENLAVLLDKNRESIKEQNKLDLDSNTNLKTSMKERLRIDDKALDSMIKALIDIKNQNEVIGEIIGGGKQPSGIDITKVRTPIGVIFMIYESRPNVTIDAFALCLKSANAVILRGGKEAMNTNKILVSLIKKALESNNFPNDCVHFIDNPDRDIMQKLLKEKDFIDVVIPRGGENLISFITEYSKIPVIYHDKGVCHAFIDESANLEDSINIIKNAKMQKPSACNAIETLLIHKNVAKKFLKEIKENLKGVELRGCAKTCEILTDITKAKECDFGQEFGDLILAIKVVENLDSALNHINEYGSKHSDIIISQDYKNIEIFLNSVDSACVYANVSSRFSDGGEFGLGAEIGISTQKLHARGPMGAKDLTTYKYIIRGNGAVRK